MIVRPLAEVPELHDRIAALMCGGWPAHYGPGGPGDAAADLRQRAAPEGLPLGWVALSVAGAEVLGTVALGPTSFGALPGEGPWLGGLIVRPDARGQGIASALCTHVAEAVSARGVGAIYATTGPASGLLRRCGWEVIRKVSEGERELQVMRITLPPARVPGQPR